MLDLDAAKAWLEQITKCLICYLRIFGRSIGGKQGMARHGRGAVRGNQFGRCRIVGVCRVLAAPYVGLNCIYLT